MSTECVTPGLLRMQWVWNWSHLGYRGCSGYEMGHAWLTEDANHSALTYIVGTQKNCLSETSYFVYPQHYVWLTTNLELPY